VRECPEEHAREAAFTGGVPDIEHLKSFLEEFIGLDRVERRLKSFHHALQHAGPIYRDYWVIPTNRFWIGLEQLRSYYVQGRPAVLVLEDEAFWTIELGVKLMGLASGMPEAVRREFATRLTAKGPPTPILFELHVASHFSQAGYDIRWSKTATSRAERAPEFTAEGHGCCVEVECKSPSVDWGQLVTRPEFYRGADNIVRCLRQRGLYGEVMVQFPKSIPRADSWHQEIAKCISSRAPRGMSELADGTVIQWELHEGGSVIVPRGAFDRRISELRATAFGHLAVAAQPDRVGVRAPILVQAKSRTDDPLAAELLSLIGSASSQLSGANPGTICCLLSEVEDISAEKVNLALSALTKRYFGAHSKPWLRDIRFFAEPRVIRDGDSLSTRFDTLTYQNPQYDGRTAA
jgi:hypothetical protein